MTALPLAFFALLWRLEWQKGGPLSLALARAALGSGLWALALTEGLGAFGLLKSWPLALGWGLPLPFLAFRLRRAAAAPARRLDAGEGALLALGLFPLFLALPLALFAAPNNYDSLFYHLPRVLLWKQQAGVGHFPAAYPLQLSYPPLAEYLLLHLHLLAGSDRFDNLLQWSCLGLGAVLVHGISLRLGAGPRGAAFAALLALTQPMALLQATSTQNDLVVSFWILVLARFALEGGLFQSALAGGLALLCKGTAYFFVPPLLALAAWRSPRKALLPLAAALALALAPSLPHWYRNLQTFGSPLGVAEDHASSSWRIPDLACGLFKNAALELAGTPFNGLNRSLIQAAGGLCRASGADPGDACCNWKGTRLGLYGPGAGWRAHDDYAGQPLHLVLILAAFFSLGLSALKKERIPGPGLLAAGALGALGYCFLVVFNPWANRLHLPFFFLALAPAGLWAQARLGKRAGLAFAALCCAAGLRFVLANETRPFSGEGSVFKVERQRQYFYSDSFARQAGLVLDFARDKPWKDIGLLLGPFRLEYPLMQALLAQDPSRRFQHLAPGNASARLRAPGQAEALLRYLPGRPAPASMTLGGRRFRLVFNAHFFAWYEP